MIPRLFHRRPRGSRAAREVPIVEHYLARCARCGAEPTGRAALVQAGQRGVLLCLACARLQRGR